MTLETLIAFSATLSVLMFGPGSGKVVVVAATIDSGPRIGAAIWSGIIAADVFWFTVSMAGFSVLAGEAPAFMLAAKLVGTGVLLWFAYRVLGAVVRYDYGPKAGAPGTSQLIPALLVGVSLAIASPKPLGFYFALIPGVVDVASMTLASYAILLSILLLMAFLSGGLYILAAYRARRWLSRPGVRRIADVVNLCLFVFMAVLIWI